MSEELADMAFAFGIDLYAVLVSAKGFSFISDNRLLDASERQQLEHQYKAYKQKISQQCMVCLLAQWQHDRTLICKYQETPDTCTPEEKDFAKALIEEKANCANVFAVNHKLHDTIVSSSRILMKMGNLTTTYLPREHDDKATHSFIYQKRVYTNLEYE